MKSGEAEPPPRAEPPLWHSLVSGSFGGFCCVAVGHPFDTLKVRLQVGTFSSRSLFSGLYNGVTAQCCGVVPFWAMYYFGYKLGRRLFPDETSITSGFCAGAVAGAVSTPAVILSETVKVVAQVKGLSSAAALRMIIRSGGTTALRRMRSVFPLTLLYMMPSQGIFFTSYEVASTLLDSEVLAGGAEGCVEWSSSLPADTVRARLYVQVLTEGQPARPLAIARGILETSGFLGLYSGISAAIVRAFVANGAAFGGIQFANRLLQP
jgi:solute carrier family 25 carnitine/acylcarnitine transporter 20/29